MVDKYKEFFQDEIEQTNAILENIATSGTIQNSIGLVLKNYDMYRKNKQLFDKLSEQ